MADKKPPPEMEQINNRWAGRVAATGRVAANALRLASRRALGRAHGEVDGLIGERLAHELDQMKGLAMKVGQILSYFEGTLPPETHAALRALQQGARPVAFATIAGVIEGALGAPVETLFDQIDRTPIAAASIGQVHRAVYRGAPVAVKVQYPGVCQTLDADFARLGPLVRVASLATAVDGAALAAELRARMVEECDYAREAAHQQAFAEAFADDPAVSIPAVVRERSAATVLTTRFAEGDDFYHFVEHADPARRDAAGLVLARFAYRSLFNLGVLNADPHPGNYLFPRDRAAVVFLDFGCVRRFEPAYLAAERALARAVLDDDRAAFPDALVATGMVPQPAKFDFDAHWALLRHQYEPYLAPRYHFTFEYVRRGAAFTGPSNPNLRRLAIPPAWIWQQRLQWGLHAVLARLDATGPFRDVLRAALDAQVEPMQAQGGTE